MRQTLLIFFTLVGIVVLCLQSLGGDAWAEEKPPTPPVAQQEKEFPLPTSYDLPRDSVLEYRALEAELRAIRAEASLALQERRSRQTELFRRWARQHNLPEDLSGFNIDMEHGRLLRNTQDRGVSENKAIK